jgi:hypothetical protein
MAQEGRFRDCCIGSQAFSWKSVIQRDFGLQY